LTVKIDLPGGWPGLNLQAVELLQAQARTLRDQAAPYQELLKAYEAQIKQITEPLREFDRLWRAGIVSSGLSALQQEMQRQACMLAPFIEEQRRLQELWRPATDKLFQEDRDCARLLSIGWLPHSSTPHTLLADPELSDEALDEKIHDYYRENWPSIQADLDARISGYDLSAETKAAFRDALEAHRHGLYRVTPRLLFPEIEQVVRVEFMGGKFFGFTSLRDLKAAAANLTLHDFNPGGMFAWRLYGKFYNHLYAEAKTAQDLAIIAADPVPNRHAALHGLLQYPEPKSSINMLVMADFVFQVVCSLKREAAEANAAAAASVT